jgi:hypothetical protein
MEVTRSPKPSMERTVQRFREQAGRNVSERRAGLEKWRCGSRPGPNAGKADVVVSGERNDPNYGPTGVVATACLQGERRNTGGPQRWARDPTGDPRGTGRAVGEVGEVQSTEEVG